LFAKRLEHRRRIVFGDLILGFMARAYQDLANKTAEKY